MLTSIRYVKFCIKMRWKTMFITAICEIIFLQHSYYFFSRKIGPCMATVPKVSNQRCRTNCTVRLSSRACLWYLAQAYLWYFQLKNEVWEKRMRIYSSDLLPPPPGFVGTGGRGGVAPPPPPPPPPPRRCKR